MTRPLKCKLFKSNISQNILKTTLKSIIRFLISRKQDESDSEEDDEPVAFHEMGLDDRILKSIAKLGWSVPTLIQVFQPLKFHLKFDFLFFTLTFNQPFDLNYSNCNTHGPGLKPWFKVQENFGVRS